MSTADPPTVIVPLQLTPEEVARLAIILGTGTAVMHEDGDPAWRRLGLKVVKEMQRCVKEQCT